MIQYPWHFAFIVLFVMGWGLLTIWAMRRPDDEVKSES
jgi:quinol-cytochrome oxidoreductase complex cytochrome b subunit